MVELAYFPALLRNIRWGNMDSYEKDKHLREPLLHDSSTEESSESEGETNREVLRKHVVVTVEPKLTRSERLMRSGWSSLTFTRQNHMNTVPAIETTQDIINGALSKLAGLTVAAVGILLLSLYRQAASSH